MRFMMFIPVVVLKSRPNENALKKRSCFNGIKLGLKLEILRIFRAVIF